jgi:hypothetical protein
VILAWSKRTPSAKAKTRAIDTAAPSTAKPFHLWYGSIDASRIKQLITLKKSIKF